MAPDRKHDENREATLSDGDPVPAGQRATVVLLLRLYLGLALFVPLGIGKLAAYPGSAAGMVERFSGTLLGWGPLLLALYLFAYLLPFWETLGGLALVVGLGTRWAFLALAALLVLLGFGSVLEFDMPNVGRNLLFLAACCWGYLWADHDRWGVDGLLSP